MSTPFTATDCSLHPHWQATITSLAAGTVFTIDPDIQHPYGICSWPPLCESWGLWTTLFSPALQPEYGGDRGHLGGVWILPFHKDSYTLFCSGVVPQEMFQIPYFMGEDPLHHNFEYEIFFLCSHPFHFMQVYMHVGSPQLDCSFLNLLMYLFINLNHCQVISISPSYGPYRDSILDRLHNFCIQLWHNMAQSTCNSIVFSFLVFNAKCESCQQFHPTMLGGI